MLPARSGRRCWLSPSSRCAPRSHRGRVRVLVARGKSLHPDDHHGEPSSNSGVGLYSSSSEEGGSIQQQQHQQQQSQTQHALCVRITTTTIIIITRIPATLEHHPPVTRRRSRRFIRRIPRRRAGGRHGRLVRAPAASPRGHRCHRGTVAPRKREDWRRRTSLCSPLPFSVCVSFLAYAQWLWTTHTHSSDEE